MSNLKQLGYFAKETALELGITASTLRRWSIELEKAGYLFERNDKGQRIYFERDFQSLK
ncbi:DNA-binding protein, partial [Bacillus badius]